MTIGKKILTMFLSFLLLTIGTGVLYFFTIYHSTANELSKTFKELNIGSNHADTEVIEATQPFTILFMGVDTGSGSRSDEWVGNSDSMLLVTVNPVKKTTTMMSLERDILVNLSDGSKVDLGIQAKLNAAYAYGGPEMAIATVQEMMNVKIDRYAMINMQGLVDLVDAVGGITVNNTLGITISIEDQEPEFTATIEPGKQKINGEQALVYARMRYQDPEGDYGRQKRQREVIQRVVEKLLSMNSVTKYQSILKAISKNVQTDIEISTETIPQLLGYRDALKNIKTYQLAGLDAMVNGVSYQVVTTEHMLEMQNVIQAALGRSSYKEVSSSALLYEDLYGVTPDPSAQDYTPPTIDVSSVNVYTGEPVVTEQIPTVPSESVGTLEPVAPQVPEVPESSAVTETVPETTEP